MIKQTPWFERSFNFDFPVNLFPVIFSRLEGTIFRLNTILMNEDDDNCATRKNGWSVKEHVGHLYDLEELWENRLSDFLSRKAVLTSADLTNTKTNEAKHNEKTLEQLLQQFNYARQKMLETAFGFDTELLSRTAVHPRLKQSLRMIDALYFVAEHDDHHISIISTLLRKPTEEAVA